MVVSDVGGLSEVVEMHETGIKVQPGNANSLAWGILYTLENPRWSAQRVQNAERVAREQYNWPRTAAMTVDTYSKVVAAAMAEDWAYRSS